MTLHSLSHIILLTAMLAVAGMCLISAWRLLRFPNSPETLATFLLLAGLPLLMFLLWLLVA